MSNDQSTHESAPATGLQSTGLQSTGGRFRMTFRVLQVRLRFVIVLVVAFLVIGLWSNIRNIWDTLAHRLAGSHQTQHTVSSDTEFFCPMDPGVVSDWPAVCPVCNMDLVRRKRGEAVVLPEGVVARMQFSPYRIQLAGIKTSDISRRPLEREIVVAGRLVDVTANRRLDSTATGPAFAIECDVFAVDVASLTPGRRARVFVDGVPGLKPLAGAVMPDEKLSLDANGRNATVRIQIEGPPASLRPGMFCTARVAVPLAEIELFGSESASSNRDAAAGFTAVPETAVVDTGTRRVVFIETMPGMFDGVEVTLGPRCGDFYPVLTGLEPGQKVAAIGAFLIDAEARLSPNLAAGYFGAARSTGAGSKATTETPPTPAPLARPVVDGKKNATNSKLSQADQKLAKLQKTCPVTDLPLDSMGGPVAVNVEGQRVFICCQGCESRLKRDPQKYLAKLKK